MYRGGGIGLFSSGPSAGSFRILKRPASHRPDCVCALCRLCDDVNRQARERPTAATLFTEPNHRAPPFGKEGNASDQSRDPSAPALEEAAQHNGAHDCEPADVQRPASINDILPAEVIYYLLTCESIVPARWRFIVRRVCRVWRDALDHASRCETRADDGVNDDGAGRFSFLGIRAGGPTLGERIRPRTPAESERIRRWRAGKIVVVGHLVTWACVIAQDPRLERCEALLRELSVRGDRVVDSAMDLAKFFMSARADREAMERLGPAVGGAALQELVCEYERRREFQGYEIEFPGVEPRPSLKTRILMSPRWFDPVKMAILADRPDVFEFYARTMRADVLIDRRAWALIGAQAGPNVGARIFSMMSDPDVPDDVRVHIESCWNEHDRVCIRHAVREGNVPMIRIAYARRRYKSAWGLIALACHARRKAALTCLLELENQAGRPTRLFDVARNAITLDPMPCDKFELECPHMLAVSTTGLADDDSDDDSDHESEDEDQPYERSGSLDTTALEWLCDPRRVGFEPSPAQLDALVTLSTSPEVHTIEYALALLERWPGEIARLGIDRVVAIATAVCAGVQRGKTDSPEVDPNDRDGHCVRFAIERLTWALGACMQRCPDVARRIGPGARPDSISLWKVIVQALPAHAYHADVSVNPWPALVIDYIYARRSRMVSDQEARRCGLASRMRCADSDTWAKVWWDAERFADKRAIPHSVYEALLADSPWDGVVIFGYNDRDYGDKKEDIDDTAMRWSSSSGINPNSARHPGDSDTDDDMPL